MIRIASSWKTPLILFAGAFLVFALYGLRGMMEPELLMRIDSATYLAPARSLLNDFSYSSPGGMPTALRVPLYPLVLALALAAGGGSLAFCVIVHCAVSALAVPLLYQAALEFSGKRRVAVTAALLMMFSPTEIAFAPMFLSEGMFVTLVTLELLFFLRFVRQRKDEELFLSSATAAFAALTRPLNVLWIFPALFVSFFVPGATGRRRILRAVIAFALFVLILAPWVIRNARIGSGWRLDEVSADSLRHNASVVESRVNGIPAQFYREQYAITFEKEFSDRKKYPDRDACLSYEERYLSAILLRHPGTYFLLFFNPSKLVPDVPTFLENLKLTTGGRGTWDVIIKDGLFAGIRHYFAGKLHLPFLLTPLILLLLATYAGAFCEVLFALAEKKWMVVLLFLLFCVYYLMVVGPGGYPRFQLPALPFLCLLCGQAADRLAVRLGNRWENREKTDSYSRRNIP